MLTEHESGVADVISGERHERMRSSSDGDGLRLP